MSKDLKDAVESFSEGGDFDQAWAEASRSGGTWKRAVAPALAAAAVLCFVGWSAFAPDTSQGSGAIAVDTAVEEAGDEADGSIQLGVGNSHIYQPATDEAPISIAVVDPAVVAVQSMGRANRFQVQGLGEGRTDMVVVFEHGVTEVVTFEVSRRFDPTLADEVIDVGLGSYLVVDVEQVPTAIAIVNPEAANISSLGLATSFLITGQALGGTDMVIQYGAGGEKVFAVRVTPDPTDEIEPLVLAKGQAFELEVSGISAVSLSDPEVMTVSTTPTGLLLMAKQAGRTDMMITAGLGYEHRRVIVE